MRLKIFIGFLAALVAVVLLFGAFSAGVLTGRFVDPASASAFFPMFEAQEQLTGLTQTRETNTTQEVDREELFKPFWQAWEIAHERFIEQPVDDVSLMRGAIKGMIEALGDDYSSYVDPEQSKQFEIQLDGGSYSGIGVWIDSTGDYLKIISPMPGSPGEKAGLKSGDIIIAVDGEDMTGIDGELVRQRVLGKKGTPVILTISREGEVEPLEIEVIRDDIVVPTVEGKIIEDNIAYIHLYTFGTNTDRDLRRELKELLKQEPAGLILDLRNNGGGYLSTAIEVVSEFIGDGVVMYEEYGDGTREIFNAQSGGTATKIPLVVLINEGTASASEIVAGAIQDRERGILVGVTSFGKGSVQIVERLAEDNGLLRVTNAKWLTPDEHQISKIGLEPEYVVEISDKDIEEGLDPQLVKAIEILTGKK